MWFLNMLAVAAWLPTLVTCCLVFASSGVLTVCEIELPTPLLPPPPLVQDE